MSKEKLVSKEETKLIPGKGRYPIPAYKGSEPYIFLSYAHKNADKVLPEIDRLRKLGYHVWYDEECDRKQYRRTDNNCNRTDF